MGARFVSKTKRYTLTPEHEAQLPGWRDRWVANALSTRPMDEADREAMRVAVRGMYEAADLTPPPPHRIVFVPSPFVLRFAAGFAAAAWAIRKEPGLSWRPTVPEGPMDWTLWATLAATAERPEDVPTITPTPGQEGMDDLSAWFRCAMPLTAHRTLFAPEHRAFAAECVQHAWQMRQGGNQWSGWVAWVSFFQHVAKLDLDYSKWQHYEAGAIHGGPRMMHPEFCLVSDRPTHLTTEFVRGEYQPHHETDAFQRWSDGSEVYAVHGTRVPAWVVRQPDAITAEKILAEPNAEVRRVMMTAMGYARFLADAKAEQVDASDFGVLWRVRMADEDLLCVEVENSTPEPDGTFRRFIIPVNRELRPLPPEGSEDYGEPQDLTALNAVASTFGLRGEEYLITAQS